MIPPDHSATFEFSEVDIDSVLSAGKKTRRRVTVEQAVVLQHSFQDNSNPTREQRVTLACELGMELRAVNVWFQNKRQAMKRKIRQSGAAALRPRRLDESRPISRSRSFGSTGSLEMIAGRAERPLSLSLTSKNDRLDHTSSTPPKKEGSDQGLWDHVLSSPPSAMSPSRARIPSTVTRGSTKKSLEWACARSTAIEKELEDSLPELDDDTDVEESNGSDTATELTTPDSSFSDIYPVRRAKQPGEEMEAAMVLLGFMRR